MTVSTTSFLQTFLGNGNTVTFSYNFPIPIAKGFILTYTDPAGNETILVPTQYTITGIGTSTGGTVTYPLTGSPMPSGATLTLERVLPLVQTITLENQGDFYPTTVDYALDYITMLIQQVSGITPIPPTPGGGVTNKQMRQALANVAPGVGQIAGWAIYTVVNALNADVASTENIDWFSGGYVIPGNALALRIQAALGYTDLQMTDLFAAAALLPQ